jgi:predicted RNA-binding Zn ribbon-like protein
MQLSNQQWCSMALCAIRKAARFDTGIGTLRCF